MDFIKQIIKFFTGNAKLRQENEALRQRITELEEQIAVLEQRLAPPAPPKIVGEIDHSRLIQLLVSTLPGLKYDEIDIADRRYKLTTVAEMNRFLAKDDTDKMRWQTDAPDCDDFTRRLLGNLTVPGWWSLPKGDIWVEWDDAQGRTHGHSIIVTVLYEKEEDPEPNVYLIEGQTDAIELGPDMFEDFRTRLVKM